MRAILLAWLAIFVTGAAGCLGINMLQQSSGLAYSTDGARIDTSWAWRSTGTREPITEAEECDTRKPWQWFFVDFGHPRGESATCRISQ